MAYKQSGRIILLFALFIIGIIGINLQPAFAVPAETINAESGRKASSDNNSFQSMTIHGLLEHILKGQGVRGAWIELVRRKDEGIPEIVLLLEKKKSPESTIHYGILVNILRDIHTPKARQALLEVAQYGYNTNNRMMAMYDLSNYGAEANDAVPYLSGLLEHDPNPFWGNGKEIKDSDDQSDQNFKKNEIAHEQSAALDTLERIGTPEAKAAAAHYLNVQKKLLKDGDYSQRSRALEVITGQSFKDGSGIPEFNMALHDPNPAIRRSAAMLLLNRGVSVPEALPVIRAGLEDPDDNVKLSSAHYFMHYAKKDPSVEKYVSDAAEKNDYLLSELLWDPAKELSPQLKSTLEEIKRKNTINPEEAARDRETKRMELADSSEDSGNAYLTFNGSFLSAGSGQLGKAAITSLLPSHEPNSAFGNAGVAYFELSQLKSAEGMIARTVGIPFAGPWSSYITSMATTNNSIFAAGYTSDSPFLIKVKTDGALDESFGNKGAATYDAETPEHVALYGLMNQAVTVQNDGKILTLAVGLWKMSAQDMHGGKDLRQSFVLARFNPDGTLDKGFGKKGLVVESPENDVNLAGERILVQPTSKIVIMIDVPHTGAFLLRFNSDGSPDYGFGENGRIKLAMHFEAKILAEADAKIVTAGFYETLCEAHGQKGGAYVFAQRFDVNGKPDNSFGANGMVNNGLACLWPPTEKPIIHLGKDGELTAVYSRNKVQSITFDSNGHKIN